MCSNCHSLSETGIRPLKNYFGGNTDVKRIETYLKGALATGNTLYMPRIPLTDEEAEALAVFLASLSKAQVAQPEKAGGEPLALASTEKEE